MKNRKKFTVYLVSGNTLTFTADEVYKCSKPRVDAKEWTYTFNDMKPFHSIDWSRVEAIKVE